MADQVTPASIIRLGLYAWFESLQVLALSPGRLRELVGREFVVTSPWQSWGPDGINGRPVLLAWQPGTRGSVTSVQFTSRDNWAVEMCLSDDVDITLLEVDEICPTVSLRQFLRHTAALTPYQLNRSHLSQEAANDAG